LLKLNITLSLLGL